ncbi:hypothetical protein ACMD2_22663 [Ananas comosus]|uniref:CCHC-type domain-containing protein n=1 Tax=Ananas comosus TaxID=4615 RepID=A0A199W5Q2_ANACO|nr:hypothetical protein ACMD2_22663 [Ananas comosus]
MQGVRPRSRSESLIPDMEEKDVRSLWDWGVTENIGVWYIARNVKPKKFIQVISEQELMAMFSIYNDMKEVEIFITIQSRGIPLNYNGEKTPTQEGNIDMIVDNIVGIASEGGEGDDDGQVAEETVGEGVGEGVGKGVDEGIGEGVGEDIGGAIGENVGQVAEEVVGEDIGENIGESFGEDVGQVAEEPAGQSDAVKTLQGEHTCTSANRCRNKVATQSWVCNRVIGWLRLDRNQGLRPAGRPRNKRIRASDEMAIRKRHRCKRCNKLGHRAKTCKNPVDVNQQAAAGPSETANQQPAAGPSQAANQQPAAAGNQQPTGPPQVGNQHSRAPIQAENQQAGDPHSEPPSQTSISSGKRRRGKRVASRSRYLQSQDGNNAKEIVLPPSLDIHRTDDL